MSLLDQIKEGIVEGDSVISLVEESIKSFETEKILNEAVIAGIQKAGQLWQDGEFFLPDVILASESFKEAMNFLEPHISSKDSTKIGKFLIGVVEGDMHDLGKSIVIAMLTSGGFEVIDLGCNVTIQTFIENIKEHKPDIVGIGAYMSTTMLLMKDLIDALKDADLRNNIKVMVGGVPVTPKYADDVGADGFGMDAIEALNTAKTLMGVK